MLTKSKRRAQSRRIGAAVRAGVVPAIAGEFSDQQVWGEQVRPTAWHYCGNRADTR